MEDVGFVWVKDRWSGITSQFHGVSTRVDCKDNDSPTGLGEVL